MIDLEKAHEALTEVQKFNPLHNDLEAYLFALVEWGLGIEDEKPNKADYGL